MTGGPSAEAGRAPDRPRHAEVSAPCGGVPFGVKELEAVEGWPDTHAAAPLADLVSRHGSYFVTGNHEYYSGMEPWVAELERLGVRPLRNERVEVRSCDAVFDLVGVDGTALSGRALLRFSDGHTHLFRGDGHMAGWPG